MDWTQRSTTCVQLTTLLLLLLYYVSVDKLFLTFTFTMYLQYTWSATEPKPAGTPRFGEEHATRMPPSAMELRDA